MLIAPVVLIALAGLGAGVGMALAAEPSPARWCGACHGPIRRQWESSSMSRSWTNPVFQAFLSDAKAALGDTIQTKCIVCHAPLASVTGDTKVATPVGQEGVTCNFCHNVSAVEVGPKSGAYTFDPTDPGLMRGPYSDSDAGKAHGSVFSPLHTRSDLCSACHYVNHPQAGVPVETTYERWKSSDRASEGEQCQDCHMPPSAGQAAPKVSKMHRDQVWAHTFHGAHGPGVLDSVATMRVSVEGGKLKLTITNQQAGHALPGGGGGMRMIALNVIFYDGSGAAIQSVSVDTYGIFYADEQGQSPVPKWQAKSLARMNEISSSEPRVATCDVPPDAKKAEATLTYHFINPAYWEALSRRQVDLSRHQPVVMTRGSLVLP